MSKRTITISGLVGAMLLLGGYLYLTVSQGKYAARVPVHFRIHAPQAKTVFVAGSFNSWQTVEHLMEKSGQGTWTATIPIAPGRYEYKFLVDTVWVLDAENPIKVPIPPPFSGYNSVIDVRPR